MSDSNIMLNLNYSDEAAKKRTPARNKMWKDRCFQKKRLYLQRQGYLENQNKYNSNMEQSRHGHAPPCLNGASTKSLPVSAHNKGYHPSSSKAGASHSSSKPSTSTHSLSSSTGPGNTGSSFVPSVSSSQKPSEGIPSKYLAFDCEMVGTGPKGRISHLARCSVVSYDGDVVYDKFIKPSVPVTDYRTRWSGIRPRDLVSAMPYSEARKEILKLLSGKVVIGHAVHNDFKVLGYSHPTALTRDTSRIPLLNTKAGIAVHECASLKRLTKAIFNRDIQTGRKGHSSVEDAKATMELYKVVEVEWERELASKSKHR
ncbi:interferon-stimulated 20 kDa exonuclease-like 2 [Acanthopagrus latus]|uniref:interferon-stimulated 20 kDa exonuclease-like 2 n=1 Tax=Acanthopagrus latus TaxID=8177 RepID=UPI00187C7AE0|nr:interferon-stimulated 20 kDa exonuclease-like 2 [Acanthopagrus latus]XP_036930120.1 interferon-stimulated 20 kDa exonuclease-like 2 [Acanthopagrus latus]